LYKIVNEHRTHRQLMKIDQVGSA